MLHSQASHEFMAVLLLQLPKSWGYRHEAVGVLRGLGKLTYNLTFDLLLCLHPYSMWSITVLEFSSLRLKSVKHTCNLLRIQNFKFTTPKFSTKLFITGLLFPISFSEYLVAGERLTTATWCHCSLGSEKGRGAPHCEIDICKEHCTKGASLTSCRSQTPTGTETPNYATDFDMLE